MDTHWIVLARLARENNSAAESPLSRVCVCVVVNPPKNQKKGVSHQPTSINVERKPAASSAVNKKTLLHQRTSGHTIKQQAPSVQGGRTTHQPNWTWGCAGQRVKQFRHDGQPAGCAGTVTNLPRRALPHGDVRVWPTVWEEVTCPAKKMVAKLNCPFSCSARLQYGKHPLHEGGQGEGRRGTGRREGVCKARSLPAARTAPRAHRAHQEASCERSCYQRGRAQCGTAPLIYQQTF